MGHKVWWQAEKMTMRIRAYVLAGGRSSRMGTDKAMLVLGGRTLLGRVVDCLRQVESLKDEDGRVVVTVAGERAELEGADRAIVDRYEGCGPMGGMEAALRDLAETHAAEWAFFIPVDMPFVPPAVIDALLKAWMDAARDGAMVCHAIVDGREHPLLSLVHRSLHPYLVEALEAGLYKVLPILQSGGSDVASARGDGGAEGISGRVTATHVSGDGADLVIDIAALTQEQAAMRSIWFSNLNSMEDVKSAETFLARPGSIEQPPNPGFVFQR